MAKGGSIGNCGRHQSAIAAPLRHRRRSGLSSRAWRAAPSKRPLERWVAARMGYCEQEHRDHAEAVTLPLHYRYKSTVTMLRPLHYRYITVTMLGPRHELDLGGEGLSGRATRNCFLGLLWRARPRRNPAHCSAGWAARAKAGGRLEPSVASPAAAETARATVTAQGGHRVPCRPSGQG